MIGSLRAYARALNAGEWLALGAGLAVLSYIGWDGALWDARLQLLLHLVAIGAILGLTVIGLRGGLLPMTRIDVPLLGLLAAFSLATASAANLGMSLRALAAVVATALMLPVALVAIRRRPTWVGLVTAVPVLALSVPVLLAMLARRAEWIAVGAPGLPPIRLPAETTFFGSVAVAPFAIWPAWALAGLVEHAALRRYLQLGLAGAGIPLTVLSGSRSAWLAIGVAVVVGVGPWLWRRRGRLRWPPRITPSAVVLAVLAAAAAVIGLVLVIPRLTAVTSLLYRAALWRDTLSAWAADPLLGLGPGIMPHARQAAAADFSFPVRQPHSHNVPLGLLGDAGIVGLIAGLLLVAAIARVAGPWRSRTPAGGRAGVVLIGLAVGSLFEDLTFLPNFNLLVVALVALALTDAGAVRWVRLAKTPQLPLVAARVGAAAAGLVLLAAMVMADAGAVAYRSGIDAAADGRWTDAVERLTRSVAIDPWHPEGFRALAVAADAVGDTGLARRAAHAAVERNPGDGESWVNLALSCAALGDRSCQVTATQRAAATASFTGVELVNAAFSFEQLGQAAPADDAYRRSLLSQRLTTFATDWPRDLRIGDATVPDQAGAEAELYGLLARHAVGDTTNADSIADPATRALAHAMAGERSEAQRWLERAIAESPDAIATWDVALVLRRHWGQPIEHQRAIARVVRGRSLPGPDAEPMQPVVTFDVATFRMHPRDGLVRSAIRLATRPAYPWVLEQLLP